MIDDPNFSLDLDASWRPLPTDHFSHYAFADETRDVTMLLSATSQSLLPEDLDFFARTLIDLELEKEQVAAQVFGHAVTIYEPVVVPRPWGRAIAYYGHDAGGRHFSFSGSMTCHCKIGLYMWTSSLTENALLAVIDDIASRIVFDRAPIGRDLFN